MSWQCYPGLRSGRLQIVRVPAFTNTRAVTTFKQERRTPQLIRGSTTSIMSGPPRTFSSAICILICDLCMVLVVFTLIGAVTASPQRSGSERRIQDTNKNTLQSKQYGYTYFVDNVRQGHNFNQSQASNGGNTQSGRYEVPFADGRTQIVTYTADEGGYRAVVTWVNTKYENSVRVPDNVKATSSGSAGTLVGRSANCNILPNPGECRGAFPRFFYNSTSSQCDCFLYGGCDDEEPLSSWLTLEDCSATCSPDKTEAGPRCRIAAKEETQTFIKPYKPSIIEVLDTSNLSDAELLGLFAQ